MIKYILLGFIKYGPMTGYEIKQNMEHSTAHFWHAHHSQIYTTLRKMEQEGLVSSQLQQQEGSPDRRVYSLLPAGRQILNEWLEHPQTEATPIKEDFLVRIFFSATRDPQEVIAEVRLHIKLHQEKIIIYQATQNHLENDLRCKKIVPDREIDFWLFTLDMGFRFEKMYIEWLTETLSRLQQM
jgi:PadR family transcriptional regulator, regulatory protein AphA